MAGRSFLVTGGCGFLGSNLAREILARGERLAILDNLSRTGSGENLEWLKAVGPLEFIKADVREFMPVRDTIDKIRPDVIFHLAGQVAMTTSIADPRNDFEVNALGSLNILESVRTRCPEAAVIYSSTNKVYGDLADVSVEEGPTRWSAPAYDHGFDETLPLEFHSPYGCSKGAADQYMLDYARIYGVKTVVFRHSSIFGDRQFSTYDQGWIGWFIKEALDRAGGRTRDPIEVSGDGKQVRDVLFVSDAVNCYFAAAENIDKGTGEAFNIGGTMRNSISLLELFEFLGNFLGVELTLRHLPWRASDQKVFVADIRKATRTLNWSPSVARYEGIRRMVDWTQKHG